jgi:hypothetical protein
VPNIDETRKVESPLTTSKLKALRYKEASGTYTYSNVFSVYKDSTSANKLYLSTSEFSSGNALSNLYYVFY